MREDDVRTETASRQMVPAPLLHRPVPLESLFIRFPNRGLAVVRVGPVLAQEVLVSNGREKWTAGGRRRTRPELAEAVPNRPTLTIPAMSAHSPAVSGGRFGAVAGQFTK